MTLMDLYNWYEESFPNDFKQLVQLKHYCISDLSFMLSKIWYQLHVSEKLLMCAIYYDDFNLAEQLLSYERNQFKLNPFYGKRYFTQTPCKTYLSSSSSTSGICQTTAPQQTNGNKVKFYATTTTTTTTTTTGETYSMVIGKHDIDYKPTKSLSNSARRSARETKQPSATSIEESNEDHEDSIAVPRSLLSLSNSIATALSASGSTTND